MKISPQFERGVKTYNNCIERNDSEDSLIKLFTLNNKDNLEEEEDQLSDIEVYLKNVENEELQTELPRRIFNASRILAHRISKLDKDEFGDYVYREMGINIA